MRLSTIFLIFSLLICCPAKADDGGGNFAVGGVQLGADLCMQYSLWSSMITAWQQTQWPIDGVPGVAIGFTVRSNPIIDTCEYILFAKQVTQMDALNGSALALNKMTQLYWAKHTGIMSSSTNLAVGLVNFGGNPGAGYYGAMDQAWNVRHVVDAVDEKKLAEQEENQLIAAGNDPYAQEEISRFAQAASESAYLNELLICPTRSDNIDYVAAYGRDVEPEVINTKKYKMVTDYYLHRLTKIGSLILHDEKDLKEYRQWLVYITDNVVASVTYDSVGLKNYVPQGPSQADPSVANAPKLQTVTAKVEIKNIQANSVFLSKFTQKYNPIWTNYVKDNVMRNDKSSGFFNSFSSSTNDYSNINEIANWKKDMSALYWACAPEVMFTRISVPITQKEAFTNQYNTAFYNCKKDEQPVSASVYYDMLNTIVRKYNQYLIMLKTSQAKIDNFVVNATKKNKTMSSSSTQFVPEAKCKDNMTAAELQYVSIKMQSVQNKLNEQMARDTIESAARARQDAANRDMEDRIVSEKLNMINNAARKQSASDSVGIGEVTMPYKK
jgi:hypothetical protein